MNHMTHIAATTQIRLNTPGPALYRRRLAAGKTKAEAMRVSAEPPLDRERDTGAGRASGRRPAGGPAGASEKKVHDNDVKVWAGVTAFWAARHEVVDLHAKRSYALGQARQPSGPVVHRAVTEPFPSEGSLVAWPS